MVDTATESAAPSMGRSGMVGYFLDRMNVAAVKKIRRPALSSNRPRSPSTAPPIVSAVSFSVCSCGESSAGNGEGSAVTVTVGGTISDEASSTTQPSESCEDAHSGSDEAEGPDVG